MTAPLQSGWTVPHDLIRVFWPVLPSYSLLPEAAPRFDHKAGLSGKPTTRYCKAETLIDTVPTGHRCLITGGAAQPFTVTTPRLVALHDYGDSPVIDCFGAGFCGNAKR